MANELYKIEDLQQLSPALQTRGGLALLRTVEKITSLDKLNRLYMKSMDTGKRGPDLAEELCHNYGISYEVGGLDLDKLPQGPFITISNHPYGGADGLALIDLFGHIRPDLKVMVNKILGMAKGVSQNMITVTPTGEVRTAASPESVQGIKMSIEQIRSGGVLGLFPSGAVSDFKLKEWKVRDREWQLPVIKLIRKLNVPVVPVRFFDRNSNFYYSLGLINWKVRLLRLPREVMNKAGKQMRIGIGEVIDPAVFKEYGTLEELRDFLRSTVYDMPLPKTFTPRSELNL